MQSDTENVLFPESLLPRTKARIAAVQALYQMEITSVDVGDVVKEFQKLRFKAPPQKKQKNNILNEDTKEDFSDTDTTFFSEIVYGVVRCQRNIDPMIHEQLATGWRLVRVDAILRAILRAGTYEMVEMKTIPGRVIINEYINIAHAFFSEDEPRVVNGILDKIGRITRPNDFK
ncbi:MAG: transcription antitermination factor NusB [Hyphomicrobium sp.]